MKRAAVFADFCPLVGSDSAAVRSLQTLKYLAKMLAQEFDCKLPESTLRSVNDCDV